jgi:toxin ParE1/3/4
VDRLTAWSPEAVEDLRSIADYIQRDSAFYAKSVVSKLIKTAARLCDFPTMGREVPELQNPAIREIAVYSYRMIYRFNEPSKQVLIIAIIHGRRLIDAFSDRFE